MRKTLQTFLIAVALWGGASIASAHVLKTDGDIGAVIHVTPDDDPVAGEETTFYFDIKDRQNKFNPAACDCIVTIKRGEEQLAKDNLFQNAATVDINTPNYAYTFPGKAIYSVEISGKPKAGSDFQPFKLAYDLRVAKEANTGTQSDSSSKSNNLIPYILFGIGLVVIIAFVLKDKYKTKKS